MCVHPNFFSQSLLIMPGFLLPPSLPFDSDALCLGGSLGPSTLSTSATSPSTSSTAEPCPPLLLTLKLQACSEEAMNLSL